MDTSCTAEFFVGNRRRLRQLVAEAATTELAAPIVVTANGLLQRTADNTYAFTQEKNFWYLTGISEPDMTLVIDGNDEYLMIPSRTASREAFDGIINKSALTEISGIQTIIDENAGWKKLESVLREKRSVHSLAAVPGYIEAYGMYTNPARGRLLDRIKTCGDDIAVHDIRSLLSDMRVIKQPPEIAAIKEAIAVTVAGLGVVTRPENLKQYTYEYEIEADLSRAFRRSGAGGHAFAPIVAGGKRACTFHNFANNSPLAKNELVVLDVGAEYNHYSADITRTIALQKPTQRQQDVYDAVLDVQTYGISVLKPGTSFKEAEQLLRVYMGKALQSLGLITDDSEESVHKYYPHAPHFLGLDVHDVGDYSRPLEPGMVLTCEPGIYIPEEAIGIRLEDDILITAEGNEVLSDNLPKTLD
jgi:Xaa-Pro aminopeptidase